MALAVRLNGNAAVQIKFKSSANFQSVAENLPETHTHKHTQAQFQAFKYFDGSLNVLPYKCAAYVTLLYATANATTVKATATKATAIAKTICKYKHKHQGKHMRGLIYPHICTFAYPRECIIWQQFPLICHCAAHNNNDSDTNNNNRASSLQSSALLSGNFRQTNGIKCALYCQVLIRVYVSVYGESVGGVWKRRLAMTMM